MKRTVALVAVAVVAVLGALFLFAARGDDEAVPQRAREAVTPEEVVAPGSPAPMVRAPAPGAPRGDGRAAGDPAPPDPEAEGGLQVEPIVDDPVPEVVRDLELTVWPLNRDGLQGAVNEVLPGIQRCYQDALTEIPDLAGKLSVGFAVTGVDGTGKVTEAWIEDDQLRDGPLSDCVQDAMTALQFDPPEGDGSMEVTYPIVFRPE